MARQAVDGSETEFDFELGATALDAESGADAEAAGVADAAAKAAGRDVLEEDGARECGGSVYQRARVADIVEMFGGRRGRSGGDAAGADCAAGGGSASGSPGAHDAHAHAAAYGGGEAASEQSGAVTGADEVAMERGGDEQAFAEVHAPQDATGLAGVGGASDARVDVVEVQQPAAGADAVEHAPMTAEEPSGDRWETARSRRAERRQRVALPQPPPSCSRGDSRGQAEVAVRDVSRQSADSGAAAESEAKEHEAWFACLSEVVEQVAEGGPEAGIAKAAHLMHLGAATETPRKVGRDFRCGVALLRTNGSVVASGEGHARLAENAIENARAALAVQVVRLMGRQLDASLESAGFLERERQSVAAYVSIQETIVDRMPVETSDAARWRVLRTAMKERTGSAGD